MHGGREEDEHTCLVVPCKFLHPLCHAHASYCAIPSDAIVWHPQIVLGTVYLFYTVNHIGLSRDGLTCMRISGHPYRVASWQRVSLYTRLTVDHIRTVSGSPIMHSYSAAWVHGLPSWDSPIRSTIPLVLDSS